MNPTWVRVRSWHAVHSAFGAGVYTRCGRAVAGASPTADLPANVKTCETCLRLLARDAERNG